MNPQRRHSSQTRNRLCLNSAYNIERKKIIHQNKKEEKLDEKDSTSSIIKDLIIHQEEKVQDIINNNNQFKEKAPKIDFADWLRLKSISSQKNTKEKERLKPQKEIEKTEIKEDLIPFERTSAIEAEMHREVKASTDPLDHFISSEIIRKKKKRENKKQVIVSETLAEILTLQQKYSEALEVYELLSLKYPQKSIYFANQIEKIKNYL